MKSTPVSNVPNAVVVDEVVAIVAIVEGIAEGIAETEGVVLVEVAELQGVVEVVKMVLPSPTSTTNPPSLP